MMDGTKKRQNIWKLFRKGLVLGLLLLLLGVIGHTLFSDNSMNAQADSHYLEVTLTQTMPEEGFLMIPGVAIPQDITASIEKTTEHSYVYVKVVEQNNEHDYLLYEMAEGWLPLNTLAGDPIPGVYYRCCDGDTSGSWPILKDQQITVNPETVTWSVLEQLSADTTGESWPRLIYEAYGVALEYSDELMTPLDGWSIVDGSKWKVVVQEIIPPAPAIITALQAPDDAEVFAYDVTLQDVNGYCMQPYEPVEVQLPVATGADAAIVLHVLDSGSKIRNAIPNGNVIGLQTTDTEKTTLVEVIEAKVVGGNAEFEAASFSTYYVVSGHNETLKSWWQDSSGGTTEENTRFNVDRRIYGLELSDPKEQTYYVEPDSTLYLYVKDGTVTARNITENTSGGTITLSGAVNDPAGLLVKVSGTAQDGQKMTFTVNGTTTTVDGTTVNAIWTVNIIVKHDVIEGTFDNADYPVYVGITFDPTKISIANEPRVSGNDTNDWTYITNMSSLTMTGDSSSYKQKDVIAPVAGSKAVNYLYASIQNHTFLEGTDDDSVKGWIDTEMATTDGYPPTIELDDHVHSIGWKSIAEKLLKDSNISSKIKATDGTTPTMTNYGEVGGYVLQPYVVKLQTSKYVGWHINACFVPVRDANTQWMNFDENLPEGAYIDYLNVPLRKPLKTGSTDATTALMYSVQPGGTDYVAISESEYITLSDGRKLRFIGWNTQSDGSGCQYPGQGATYSSPSNDSNYWGSSGTHNHQDENQIAGIKKKNPFLDGKTGTMYAFWSAIAERLELHKVVESDVTISSPATFEFKLTITSLEGVKLSQDGKDKIVFELYDAATDTLVPNSKDSNTALAVNNTVTIRMTANQYAAIFLPTSTQYKIEEVNIPSGYTQVNSVNAEGIIGGKGNDGNVIFTNSYNSTKGFLNLEKTVAGEEADPEQLFTFTVTFADENISADKSNSVEFTLYDNLDKPIVDINDRVIINEANEIYTVLLKHGERIVFSGLEAGTTYAITETTVENYAATVTTQTGDEEATEAADPTSGTIVEDKFTNVVYTNTYNQPESDGTLTITKAFKDCTPEDGESFVFTVKNNADNAVVAEVVIYGAGSKTIQVPYGDYTVTEDNAWSWRYTAAVSPSQPVTVSSTFNPTVTFTNTKSNPNWLDASAGVTNRFSSATQNGGEQQ